MHIMNILDIVQCLMGCCFLQSTCLDLSKVNWFSIEIIGYTTIFIYFFEMVWKYWWEIRVMPGKLYSLWLYKTTHCGPVHIWLYTSKHFIWQYLDIDRKNTICCTQCVRRIQLIWANYSKTCLIWPLKIDKTKIVMTNDSLMKVESIAECYPWSILQYFWPALSDNWSWKPIFGLFESSCFKLILL